MRYHRFLSPNRSSSPHARRIVVCATRRICPGRYFADASLFILTATLLHAFEILPPEGMSADQLVLNASGMGVVS